jgi:hypothetical protein
MPKTVRQSAEDETEPLVDTTQALQLNSKKLERLRKKQQKRAAKNAHHAAGSILDLPYELITDILELLRPSDIFRLSRTCKAFHTFLGDEETNIAKKIIDRRYVAIAKCFRLPVRLSELDQRIHPLLQDESRQEIHTMKKKPYQHLRSPDPQEICTCMTCLLRWHSLNLIVDFNYWQDNLDKGEPIPMIPRGRNPSWNIFLIDDNASYVSKALQSPLWHALLLEVHLNSMIRSIARQRENKGNKRRRFRMTEEDENSGTDLFLERSGPPSTELPFHRDQYYLLETYMPNRGWNGEEGRWMYMPADQHERDVAWVVRVAEWRARKKMEEEMEAQRVKQFEQ